jgi:hypothetical protein
LDVRRGREVILFPLERDLEEDAVRKCVMFLCDGDVRSGREVIAIEKCSGLSLEFGLDPVLSYIRESYPHTTNGKEIVYLDLGRQTVITHLHQSALLCVRPGSSSVPLKTLKGSGALR